MRSRILFYVTSMSMELRWVFAENLLAPLLLGPRVHPRFKVSLYMSTLLVSLQAMPQGLNSRPHVSTVRQLTARCGNGAEVRWERQCA